MIVDSARAVNAARVSCSNIIIDPWACKQEALLTLKVKCSYAVLRSATMEIINACYKFI